MGRHKVAICPTCKRRQKEPNSSYCSQCRRKRHTSYKRVVLREETEGDLYAVAQYYKLDMAAPVSQILAQVIAKAAQEIR